MEAYTNKKYVCIMYPGVVKNEERMLETLGGINNISHVYSLPNRRLDLRYRPDDIYCRSTCGDRQKSVSFLLKVKVRRRKVPVNNLADSSKSSNENLVTYEPIIMGHVETIFNFKSLGDFQFLPIQTENGATKVIYDEIVPKEFPPVDWLQGEAPLFLPPATFSRMDSMQFYLYRKESKSDQTPGNIIGRTRHRRSAHAVFVTFDVPAAPSKPRVSSLKYLELKFLAGEPYIKLSQLFQERPIWSKTALAFETKFTKEQLKYLVPSVAYYFVTGPFRVMWVRMGYDPRKDPTSRIYQTLDYRIPNKGGLSSLVKAKRRSETLKFKSISTMQVKPSIILSDSKETDKQDSKSTSDDNEFHYIFKRGVKLPARQIFYQYCDIKVPEVEEMFTRLPKPAPGTECHKQRGWLPSGFAERVREIITNIVYEDLEKEKSLTDIKAESPGINEEQDGEDEYDDDDDDEDEEDDEFNDEAISDDANISEDSSSGEDVKNASNS